MQYAAVIRKKMVVAARATAVMVERWIIAQPRSRCESANRALARSEADIQAPYALRPRPQRDRRAGGAGGRAAHGHRRPSDRRPAPGDTAPQRDRLLRRLHGSTRGRA